MGTSLAVAGIAIRTLYGLTIKIPIELNVTVALTRLAAFTIGLVKLNLNH